MAHGTEGLRGKPAHETERVQLVSAVQEARLVRSRRLSLLDLLVGRCGGMNVLEANGTSHLTRRRSAPAWLLARPLLLGACRRRRARGGAPAPTYELEALE